MKKNRKFKKKNNTQNIQLKGTYNQYKVKNSIYSPTSKKTSNPETQTKLPNSTDKRIITKLHLDNHKSWKEVIAETIHKETEEIYNLFRESGYEEKEIQRIKEKQQLLKKDDGIYNLFRQAGYAEKEIQRIKEKQQQIQEKRHQIQDFNDIYDLFRKAGYEEKEIQRIKEKQQRIEKLVKSKSCILHQSKLQTWYKEQIHNEPNPTNSTPKSKNNSP